VDRVDEDDKVENIQGYKYEAPFDIPRGRLVTLHDQDGNIVGLICSSKGEMPDQRA
jgi:hypothetical protein